MDISIITNYLLSTWLIAGTIMGAICSLIILWRLLKNQGYLDIYGFLMGVLFMGFYIAGGWITLALLIYLFKEYFSDSFTKLMKVKLFQTRAYKTKSLLFKNDETDTDEYF